MGHYAKVVDEMVVRVIVAEAEFFDTFVDDSPGTWIQTSYNTHGGVHYIRNDDGSMGDPSADQSKALRKNYAALGFRYDEDRDAFIPPKPHDSWTLNETTCLWDAPVAYPDDGKVYLWNESISNWTEIEGGYM